MIPVPIQAISIGVTPSVARPNAPSENSNISLIGDIASKDAARFRIVLRLTVPLAHTMEVFLNDTIVSITSRK